jgi:hypothetical protein
MHQLQKTLHWFRLVSFLQKFYEYLEKNVLN